MGYLLLILGAGIIAFAIAYRNYDDPSWAALWAITIILLGIMIALFVEMFKLIA